MNNTFNESFPTEELIKTFKDSGQYDFVNKFTKDEIWKLYLLFVFLNPQPEIIKCKDCKYNNNSPECSNANCKLFYSMTDQMGFCSYAERRQYEI